MEYPKLVIDWGSDPKPGKKMAPIFEICEFHCDARVEIRTFLDPALDQTGWQETVCPDRVGNVWRYSQSINLLARSGVFIPGQYTIDVIAAFHTDSTKEYYSATFRLTLEDSEKAPQIDVIVTDNALINIESSIEGNIKVKASDNATLQIREPIEKAFPKGAGDQNSKLVVADWMLPVVNGSPRNWDSSNKKNPDVPSIPNLPNPRYSVRDTYKCETKVDLNGDVYFLRLSGSAVDDDTLRNLQQILENELSNVTGVNRIPKCLNELTSLKTINLSKSKITDKSMRDIGGLHTLKTAWLDGTNITDQGVSNLGDLANLENLWLSRTKITDLSVITIVELKNLRNLWLEDVRVTAEAVIQLGKLKALRKLMLKGTDVGDFESLVKEFGRSNPGLQIGF